MKSVSLTYAEVMSILEAHLNAHELKTAHTVVAIDPWAYGPGSSEMQFDIALAPGLAGQPPVTPDPGASQVLHAVSDAMTTALLRSNGHDLAKKNGGGKATTEDAPEPPPAARKRSEPVTDEQRQRIVDLVNAGAKRADIADAVGIKLKRLYEVLAELRAAGRLPDRLQPAVA